ncbi:DNA polymerase nu [Pleuronectes platessa]|nr:DNA polymerase nu [Pleuronectes platessa]
MRQGDEEEDMEQTLDVSEAATGKMIDGEHEIHKGANGFKNKETGQVDATLQNKTASPHEMKGPLLGTSEITSLASTASYMDKTFLCYPEVAESGQEDDNDAVYKLNTLEVQNVEHPPVVESKEIPVECYTGRPERGTHTVNPEGALVQCETNTLIQSDTTADDLDRATEKRVEEVMKSGSEVETESRTNSGIHRGTEDEMETEQSLSDVQKKIERDCREERELQRRDTKPEEKRTDRDESVILQEDREDETTTEHRYKRQWNQLKDSTGSSKPFGSRTKLLSSPGLGLFCSVFQNGNHLVPHKKRQGKEESGPVPPSLNVQWFLHNHRQKPVLGMKREKYQRNVSKPARAAVSCKLPQHKLANHGPDHDTHGSKTSNDWVKKTETLTSDPRVKDSGKLSTDEKRQMLEKAEQAKTLVLTMVYQDGATQLDPEQKLPPAVCGLLVLMIGEHLDRSTAEDSLGPNDSLVYLKLSEQTPAWAQQHSLQSQELLTRDMLLQVLSRRQLVVCYKAKDLLRTALQFYKGELTSTQVAGCHIQDPQVSGWLLDPADPSSCFQDLLNKHCKRPRATPALGAKRVSQIISSLSSLYWLNMELCSKLQNQRLWELYSDMELNMIPVLAAMESHHIHVDKEALKRMSDLLGTKMKQLEQEAHRAAGQIFLVTSSTQLRTVLFEKLRLHERCENKKLPKTINTQQQSTSEAALLQLQDLHPLPKIILEYRQIHKIKSTFVDGILSCMMSKNYISSTWYQTSVVTGRISAKHPNFQALPRQPLQITKKQYIQGKEEETVTVHPRAMFIPQKGCTFLAADFCQVELRLLAHLSSDPELLRVFTNPQADVFTMLASQWKRVSEGEVTSEDREHAKRIVYSVVYGAGRERLSGILGVSAQQASQFQDSFLQTYRDVQAFIQRTIQLCHRQGYVLSIMGRRRTLPNINSPDWGIRMQAERQAVNFTVQGSAADLCKVAMIRIFNLVSTTSLTARLIAQLHDELLYEVDDSQVENFAALVKSTMESLQHIDQLGVHLRVPLKVAVSSGKSWGSMTELKIPSSSPSP